MRAKSALFFILVFSMLSACALGRKAEPTAVPTDTPTPAPTFSPTPDTPLAILLMPADLAKETSDSYQTAVYDLTQGSGMRFQVRNSLTPAEVDSSLKVVVALGPADPGIAALAAAASQAQFLAINIPGVTAGANISVLASSNQVDVPAFLAGYTAAMLSEDHHIGMLLPRGDTNAQRAAAAFANGMSYYCGLCIPFRILPNGFPQFQDIPVEEDKARYPAYADVLILQYRVDTIYLYPDITARELTDYLASTGTNIIGVSLPNPKPGTWVMTIRPDELKAIEKAWPELIAGHGGVDVQSPLGLADVDSQALSPGKQHQVQKVLDDLLAGRIATGAAP